MARGTILHQPESGDFVCRRSDGTIHRRREGRNWKRRRRRRCFPPACCARLTKACKRLRAAGAELVTGGSPLPAPGYRFANTLLRVSGEQFLAAPEKLQTEAFGNASLVVVVRDAAKPRQSSIISKAILPAAFIPTRAGRTTRFTRNWRRCCAPRRAFAERQDADRRRGHRGDEPRRAVSGDGTSGLHGRRNPGVAAAVCDAPML